MSDRLEAELTDLSLHVDWPEEDLTRLVRHHIAGVVPRSRRRLVPALAVVLVTVFSLLATPWGRQAVADLLGVAGIRIEWSTATTPPAGAGLDLGVEVPLEGAADLVDFDPLIPGAFDRPDAVYRDAVPDGGRLTMVWATSDHVEILYGQFTAEVDAGVLGKRLDPETTLRRITLRGVPGFWIEGAHVVAYLDRDGTFREDTTRLAGNVLIWSEAGVTHRIESTMTLDEVLAVAESLTPLVD